MNQHCGDADRQKATEGGAGIKPATPSCCWLCAVVVAVAARSAIYAVDRLAWQHRDGTDARLRDGGRPSVLGWARSSEMNE